MIIIKQLPQIQQWHQAYSGSIVQEADYQQRYEEHKRANKRVKIASTVVGRSACRLLPKGRKNHTYAVSSGWTWATLAQKNPKAMALDPTPSAPGKEPVVTAVRIVSLAPKAKKAGGLAVALKGTPVSPADEVDAAKEYGLITYGE